MHYLQNSLTEKCARKKRIVSRNPSKILLASKIISLQNLEKLLRSSCNESIFSQAGYTQLPVL